MAMVLVISPIFEADLLPEQYGFRPGQEAKMAMRQVFWHVSQHGRTEVVDADLRDYSNAIPHGQLMSSLRRRARRSKLRSAKFFINFSPAICNKAAKRMRQEIRSWQLLCRFDNIRVGTIVAAEHYPGRAGLH